MSIDHFYRVSKEKLIRKILPILKDRDLAEDLLHDALIRAIERYPLYDSRRASEETWFKCILFSTVWDWKRSQKRQVECIEVVLEEILDESAIVDLEVKGSEEFRAIKNPLHQRVFFLRHILGYTALEISSLLDLSEENVRKILQRVKNNF